MNLLTVPVDMFTMLKGPDYLEDETNFWVIMSVVVAHVCLIGMTVRGAAFGFIGQNVTLKIRHVLYLTILQKDIGFFDFRDNNASVITTAMAQDTSLINGASSESLGPYSDGTMALFGGLALGFYYSWEMSLICLGLTPFMILGQYIGMEFQKGLTNADKDDQS